MQNNWWIYVVLIGLLVVMLVLPMITNRKRSKEYNNMLDNIRVGDTVRTIGGIIGRITKINEKEGYKTIIIETGAKNAKTTMELDMASIYTVINQSAKPAATEKAEAAESKEENAQEKTEVAAQEQEVKAEEPKKEEPKTKKKTTSKNKKTK